MSRGVDGAGSPGGADRSGGPSQSGGPDRSGGVDRAAEARSSEEAAKAELSRAADEAPEAAAETVAREVVADADSVQFSGAVPPGTGATPAAADGGGTAVDGAVADPAAGAGALDPTPTDVEDPDAVEAAPSTEPTPENREAATGFIDALQTQLGASMFEQDADVMSSILDQVADHAAGIEDPAERDRFVRAVAVDVGLTASRIANVNPQTAYARLDAIGAGVTPDTARLLTRNAVRSGAGADNLIPYSRSGTPIGDAMIEVADGRNERLGAVLGGTARFVIPGVDAATHLAQGDPESAAASLATDAAGGALLRGGRLAAGLIGAGVALAPETAEAGVLSRFSVRLGDEAVEIQARTMLVGGRTRGFDVEVPGRFRDGSTGTLRLADERAKHNVLGTTQFPNLSRLARDISRGRGPAALGSTRNAAQFTGHYNSIEGQAELASLVMARVTPADLARVGQPGGQLDVPLDRIVGLTPTNGGRVVPASSVRVMRNNDGGFHLVPMP